MKPYFKSFSKIPITVITLNTNYHIRPKLIFSKEED